MGGGERGAVLVARRSSGTGTLLATASYGGKLVFDHAAGIPTEVLQAEMHERAEGHHHHGGEGEEAEGPTTITTTPAAGRGSADRSGRPRRTRPSRPAPGHTHAPGTPPHKD